VAHELKVEASKESPHYAMFLYDCGELQGPLHLLGNAKAIIDGAITRIVLNLCR
jgi:hypothetical protein